LDSLWRLLKPRWPRTGRSRWCRRYNPFGLAAALSAFSKVSFHGCVSPIPRCFPPPLISVQAWIEASTKGGVLLFTASEIETATTNMGMNPATGGLLGGMGGGIAQAYATMGFTTSMKTAEITRHKQAATGVKPPSTWALFFEILRKEGIRGVNKGVNAVAVRQCTNWGSRIGLARLTETSIRKVRGKQEGQSLGVMDRILSSSVGGALATWNQPIEVIRVEMQNMSKEATASANRPAKLTIFNTFGYIYKENGIKGLYRGVTPRIALGIWQTICMVSFADYVKEWVKGQNQKV
jgi:hypothetical protein